LDQLHAATQAATGGNACDPEIKSLSQLAESFYKMNRYWSVQKLTKESALRLPLISFCIIHTYHLALVIEAAFLYSIKINSIDHFAFHKIIHLIMIDIQNSEF